MSPKQPREAANLFAAAGMEEDAPRPLPDRLRPRTLADVVGQDHILGPDGALTRMRVDRFLEARFPGLSFSHIQRIVRKGELRVNGKRADSKDRLEEGQSVRIPPLKLDTPKVATGLSDAQQKTLDALKAMTLFEDADVMPNSRPAIS